MPVTFHYQFCCLRRAAGRPGTYLSARFAPTLRTVLNLVPAAYTTREELANSLTHGLGAVLSVAGLVLLTVYSALYGNVWHVVSTAIFGVTLVLLYSASTVYHSLGGESLKPLLQRFDHAAIFLLIAGSYTPFVLVPLRGPWGWSLFGIVWGLAVVGVALKFWFAGRFKLVSTLIYIGMGWLVVIAIKPLMAALPAGGVKLLVAGGLCYTGGAVFYLWKRLPYHHAVWHLFVLGGSACHWAAVFFYVVPGA
jgi:hemolysin III